MFIYMYDIYIYIYIYYVYVYYVYVYYVYIYILYIYQKFHTADSQFYFWMECAHIKIFEVSDYLLV